MEMADIDKAKMHANFGTDKAKLIKIVEGYRQRKYVEDIDIIKADYKNTEGLLRALQVENWRRGISANSLNIRESIFGTNYKEPPPRTGYCTMVCEALEDTLLRLLLVAAIFSIAVECGFSANDPEKLQVAWIEGFAILVAVATVSNVSAWSDYQKEGQFLEQQKLEENSKTVSYSIRV